ncbi:hypothetical protein CLOSTMETH_03124 [[Clostridium] methylpentosum DSM 5476]|uniref:Uncharacterized protein n=1 Tax=[Clostridium] methylpentosum DSM 5476 TaxID=537013 RepID=C0EGY0_9FIRM|nr:hypothetical protein CLOSTMETH_03124 [[Clostridium] methylpentosum DSM 5476]
MAAFGLISVGPPASKRQKEFFSVHPLLSLLNRGHGVSFAGYK